MRIRCKPWARPELDACNFCVTEPEKMIGKWHDEFHNNSPVHLELGCGKGGFISQAYENERGINFVAVDIKNEMLVLAKRKIEDVMKKNGLTADNIRIFTKNIMEIDKVFSENDKVDRIYINFCNPWPKPKHRKRRLTHLRQLLLYKSFLKGDVFFKTDDDDLFKDSIGYFKQAGYNITYTTYDLHNSEYKDKSYMTEHEKMFSEQGIKIKFLIAHWEG